MSWTHGSKKEYNSGPNINMQGQMNNSDSRNNSHWHNFNWNGRETVPTQSLRPTSFQSNNRAPIEQRRSFYNPPPTRAEERVPNGTFRNNQSGNQ